MTYAVVKNAAGDKFLVSNTVKNAAGSEFDVANDVKDADGNLFTVFSTTPLVLAGEVRFVASAARRFVA